VEALLTPPLLILLLEVLIDFFRIPPLDFGAELPDLLEVLPTFFLVMPFPRDFPREPPWDPSPRLVKSLCGGGGGIFAYWATVQLSELGGTARYCMTYIGN
jgi:hypothetical protein